MLEYSIVQSEQFVILDPKKELIGFTQEYPSVDPNKSNKYYIDLDHNTVRYTFENDNGSISIVSDANGLSLINKCPEWFEDQKVAYRELYKIEIRERDQKIELAYKINNTSVKILLSKTPEFRHKLKIESVHFINQNNDNISLLKSLNITDFNDEELESKVASQIIELFNSCAQTPSEFAGIENTLVRIPVTKEPEL